MRIADAVMVDAGIGCALIGCVLIKHSFRGDPTPVAFLVCGESFVAGLRGPTIVEDHV